MECKNGCQPPGFKKYRTWDDQPVCQGCIMQALVQAQAYQWHTRDYDHG